jgi:MFS transporter, ACS family, aldohexuronate transporter
MTGSAGGFFFPILTGALLDRFKAAGNITGGYNILFGICAFAYLVSFAIHHVLAPKFEPVPVEKTA